MLHCIVKVLCRKDEFNLTIFIKNGNFIKEKNQCTIDYILLSNILNKVVY